ELGELFGELRSQRLTVFTGVGFERCLQLGLERRVPFAEVHPDPEHPRLGGAGLQVRDELVDVEGHQLSGPTRATFLAGSEVPANWIWTFCISLVAVCCSTGWCEAAGHTSIRSPSVGSPYHE